jgi:hypothetical protein
MVRGYQWDGISWLTQLRRCGLGGILADDMGLGKSLQALVSIAIMRLELIAESNGIENVSEQVRAQTLICLLVQHAIHHVLLLYCRNKSVLN